MHYGRVIALAVLVSAAPVHGLGAQEQKVVYLDALQSSLLKGDTDGDKGSTEMLPKLLRQGWHVETIFPTSDGKAYVLLIAPARQKQ